MANIDSHPWTYAIQFCSQDVPGLISVEGFRTLLENTYEIRLTKAKRPSYLRNQAWLNAITNRDPTPPVGYTTNVASWKHEIGHTNPETSKWTCANGKVYNKTGKNTTAPHTPSEELYSLMTAVHGEFGHLGRDSFYNKVQKLSATPTKDFCNSFVNSCCSKASMWIEGGLVEYHRLPVAVSRSAAARALAPAPAPAYIGIQIESPASNPPIYGNGVPVQNGPLNDWVSLDDWTPTSNEVPMDNINPLDDSMFVEDGIFLDNFMRMALNRGFVENAPPPSINGADLAIPLELDNELYMRTMAPFEDEYANMMGYTQNNLGYIGNDWESPNNVGYDPTQKINNDEYQIPIDANMWIDMEVDMEAILNAEMNADMNRDTDGDVDMMNTNMDMVTDLKISMDFDI